MDGNMPVFFCAKKVILPSWLSGISPASAATLQRSCWPLWARLNSCVPAWSWSVLVYSFSLPFVGKKNHGLFFSVRQIGLAGMHFPGMQSPIRHQYNQGKYFGLNNLWIWPRVEWLGQLKCTFLKTGALAVRSDFLMLLHFLALCFKWKTLSCLHAFWFRTPPGMKTYNGSYKSMENYPIMVVLLDTTVPEWGTPLLPNFL